MPGFVHLVTRTPDRGRRCVDWTALCLAPEEPESQGRTPRLCWVRPAGLYTRLTGKMKTREKPKMQSLLVKEEREVLGTLIVAPDLFGLLVISKWFLFAPRHSRTTAGHCREWQTLLTELWSTSCVPLSQWGFNQICLCWTWGSLFAERTLLSQQAPC